MHTQGDIKRRNSRQRNLILCCLSMGESCCVTGHCHTKPPDEQRHFTAEEIARRLEEMGCHVGIATIYRNLKQLTDEGIVCRYTVGGASCYRYAHGEAGLHLMCVECGGVTHISGGGANEVLMRVCEDYGFTLDEGRTVIYGCCEQCRKKEKNKTEINKNEI